MTGTITGRLRVWEPGVHTIEHDGTIKRRDGSTYLPADPWPEGVKILVGIDFATVERNLILFLERA